MPTDAVFEFLSGRMTDLWLRTGEHLMLVGVSIAIAVVVGIPVGVMIQRIRWARGPTLSVVGVFQTIPSLAMLAFLLALLGVIGTTPAIIALALYALLPIVRNTYTGLDGISPELIEAGRGLGMTNWQQMWMVRVPLALPVILAGVRTAAVIGVGIATLSAFIGAGGLGEFIVRGLSMNDWRLIFLGAVPAAVLALIVDYSIGAAERALTPGPKQRRGRRGKRSGAARLLGLLPVTLLILLGLGLFGFRAVKAQTGLIQIGTKNFTEQYILAELMAQRIEATTDLYPTRRFLGGTMICHQALATGQIDLYCEYTGTALTAILHRPVVTDPDEAFRTVETAYRRRFGIEWLQPFGFENAYAITVRAEQAQKQGWETVSDLVGDAADLRAAFTSEFMEREDGYPAIREAYGLEFASVRDMDPGLMYDAINRGEIDVISAFATDGRIAAYDLKTLRDDRNALPPYDAAPLVRIETLERFPELRPALDPLTGLLDAETMRRLNYEVDGKGRSPAEVAREFLISHDLLETD